VIGDTDNNGYPDIAMVNNEGSGFNTRNYLRLWKENAAPTSLSIKPLFPTGWERFKHNSIKFIEWISSDPPPLTSKVKLEFSSTAGAVDINPRQSVTTKYQWAVPYRLTQ
jgi:hypothetical protein